MTQADVLAILPLILVAGSAVILLVAELWVPVERRYVIPLLAVLALLVALFISVGRFGQPAQLVAGGLLVVDGFAVFLDTLFLASGIAAVALAYDYLKRTGIERGEYYVFLLLTLSGMMLMTVANDLVIVFLALELLSIPLYVLAGFAQPRVDSEESSLKYFLLGTFAAGFVLYGVALLYGATGRTDLPGVAAGPLEGSFNQALFLAGAALLLVGFGFKVAAVPFHEWAPDVYQGAPTPVTGFMSVGAKAAGIAALLRVFMTAFPSLTDNLVPVLAGLAALTMIVGNITAIAQTNLKRMLAYSSIAHGGYLMMAFVTYGNPAMSSATATAMVYYLAAYAFTSFAAWAVVVAVERNEGGGLELGDVAGLVRRHPGLALAMAVAMLSFVGIPPTMGFWGKFYLFRTAVEGGYTWLALVGLLTSLVSAYYYLRVVVVMFMRPGEAEAQRDPWLRITAVLSALAVVVLSLVPAPLFELASRAVLGK